MNRYVWLDLARGFSALLVCAGHLRNVALVDYGELPDPGLFVKFLYLLTGLGHQAVMVFFVLSGFLVGGSVLKAGSNFSVLTYAISRLTRLWIVLLPALILTFLVDGYLSKSAPEVMNGVFNSTWHSGPKSKSEYSNSIATFLGNLLFLQTIIVPVFGTNGPLWSLANEFWYYVLFPLLAVVAQSTRTDRNISRRLLAAGIAALVLLFLPMSILIGFLIWLLGAVVFWISAMCSVKTRPTALVMCGALFAASLAYSKSERWQSGLGVDADLVVGLAFAALCLIISTWPNPQRSRFGIVQTKIYEAMSDFSYSLYLSHFPFVVVIGAMYYGEGKVIPALGSLLVYLLWLLVLMVFAFIFWWCFERHTDYFRRVLTKRTARHDGHVKSC